MMVRAIGQERREHARELRPIADRIRAAHRSVVELADDRDAVGLGVGVGMMPLKRG